MRLINNQLNISQSTLPAATMAGFYVSHIASLFLEYNVFAHAYCFSDSNNRTVYGNFESEEKQIVLLEGLHFLQGSVSSYDTAAFLSFGAMTKPEEYGFEYGFFATFGKTGKKFNETTSQVVLPCFITDSESYVGFKAAHLLKPAKNLEDESGQQLIMENFYQGVEEYMKVQSIWLDKDNPHRQ